MTQLPRAETFYSGLEIELGIPWRVIKIKVDALKRKWKAAKGEGETGIGLAEPGSVLARRQAKCNRFSELDQLFTSRQPQSAGTSYGDLPSTSSRERSVAPQEVPPAQEVPPTQEISGEPDIDPNTETVGDSNLPNLGSRRRVRRAPRTVMSGFVNVERTLQDVSNVEMDIARERSALAREEIRARKEIQKDEMAMQTRYHDLMEGELELRVIELRHKIEQDRFDNDIRRRRLELMEAKERRRQMKEERLSRL